ncbi:MAG: heme ABC transporter permease CcmC [Phenylobacterium sp.]|nr:heme ABC transporter permease CcmC [Phenylobacterium sp.]MDP3852189.1 heme ABC transporter permease CcmC [Phenylobacterium sp.]
MAFSRWAAPMFGVLAAGLAAAGLWLAFAAPEDYQQGDTVRIMFVHVPAAYMASFVYACLAGASFLSLVFRHALADAAAQAAAPLGAAFTFLALVTGALWGAPMWGTWWVWDARLTSVLVLLLLYLAYMALRASLDDETKAARAAAILALVGIVNLPVVKFSVDWWNSLHQGATVFRADGPAMGPEFLWPLALMALAYTSAFGSLWLVGIRGEVWRRRAEAAALRAARS